VFLATQGCSGSIRHRHDFGLDATDLAASRKFFPARRPAAHTDDHGVQRLFVLRVKRRRDAHGGSRRQLLLVRGQPVDNMSPPPAAASEELFRIAAGKLADGWVVGSVINRFFWLVGVVVLQIQSFSTPLVQYFQHFFRRRHLQRAHKTEATI